MDEQQLAILFPLSYGNEKNLEEIAFQIYE
jgi:hypothetical protein